ncbi:MAG: ABC transporter permease [Blautia sp.]|nr:ABC transporter permease [Blautia sp.]
MKKRTRHGNSHFRDIVHQLFKNRLAVAGLVIIILTLLIAVFAPVLAPYDYALQDYTALLQGPSMAHPMGTDNLGRDTLSRIIYGARFSLMISYLSVFGSAVIGITFGSIAGYFGGAIDNILMRFLDVYQSIPVMIVSVALATALGPGIFNTTIALAISVSPFFARMARAQVLTVREMEYIEAAQVINGKSWYIILRHALPNAFAPLLVNITMSFGASLLTAATLSFVGLGAQPPSPEWGAMLSFARGFIREDPLLIVWPGLTIMINVLAFNLFGDGLRDALDPRQQK